MISRSSSKVCCALPVTLSSASATMKTAVEKKYEETCGRNLPLPKALLPAWVYLKLDLLVFALLRL